MKEKIIEKVNDETIKVILYSEEVTVYNKSLIKKRRERLNNQKQKLEKEIKDLDEIIEKFEKQSVDNKK